VSLVSLRKKDLSEETLDALGIDTTYLERGKFAPRTLSWTTWTSRCSRGTDGRTVCRALRDQWFYVWNSALLALGFFCAYLFLSARSGVTVSLLLAGGLVFPTIVPDLAIPVNNFPSVEAFSILKSRDVRYVVIDWRTYNDAASAVLRARFPPFRHWLRPLVATGDVYIYEIVGWPE